MLLSMIFCLTAIPVIGQIRAPSYVPDSPYKHSISAGPSIGAFTHRDAYFWGVSVGYAYKLNGPWAISPSLAYDQEIEQQNDQTNKIDTYTFLATVSYFITPKWSLTTGLAKGFADDDNQTRQLDFVDGDVSTGISVGYSLPDFPFWTRESFSISGAYEYNITKNEFSVSLDLVIGLSW